MMTTREQKMKESKESKVTLIEKKQAYRMYEKAIEYVENYKDSDYYLQCLNILKTIQHIIAKNPTAMSMIYLQTLCHSLQGIANFKLGLMDDAMTELTAAKTAFATLDLSEIKNSLIADEVTENELIPEYLNKNSYLAQIEYHIGMIYLNKKEYTLARLALNNAMEHSNKISHLIKKCDIKTAILLALGRIDINLGNYSHAYTLFNQALAMNVNDNYVIYQALGMASFKLGDKWQAINMLKKALDCLTELGDDSTETESTQRILTQNMLEKAEKLPEPEVESKESPRTISPCIHMMLAQNSPRVKTPQPSPKAELIIKPLAISGKTLDIASKSSPRVALLPMFHSIARPTTSMEAKNSPSPTPKNVR